MKPRGECAERSALGLVGAPGEYQFCWPTCFYPQNPGYAGVPGHALWAEVGEGTVFAAFEEFTGFSRNGPCILGAGGIRAEASILASQSSTQLNAEFRAIEYDSAAEMDECRRIQMERGSQFEAEETIETQRILYLQKAGGKTPKKRRPTR